MPKHLYVYSKAMREWLDAKGLAYHIIREQGMPKWFGFDTKEDALHCKLIAKLRAEG